MKIFKSFAVGFFVALLLVCTINSKAEAVADIKACWTMDGSFPVVIYLTHVGDDIYSANGKIIDSSQNKTCIAMSGTAVVGATEATVSVAFTMYCDAVWMDGTFGTFTFDLATLNGTYEWLQTQYNRDTAELGTVYIANSTLIPAPCP